jgi:hypothetical protein
MARDILLAIHIIGAVIWIGAGASLNLIGVRLIRTNP